MEFLEILKMLGSSLLAVEGLMILFWIIFLFNDRINIVDIAWGLSFLTATTLYFILGEGYYWRKWLVLITVFIWGIRHIAYMVARYEKGEDPRYKMIIDEEQWKILSPIRSRNVRVLLLFLFEGILIVVLSLPFALMMQNDFPYFETLEIFGLLVWMVGLSGASLADRQLQVFKENPLNNNQVCERGLWRYSRHPNYFFEWVIWIGFFMMASTSTFGWMAVISPLLMFFFLFKISGIPLAEEEALRTKGEAYQKYQEKTSSFFPWFRK